MSENDSFRETRGTRNAARKSASLRIYVLNETWRTRWNKLGYRVVRSEIYERPVLEHSKETARKLEMDFEPRLLETTWKNVD